MFFKARNPSCQSRIAVLNIRFSVSIVLLLLPRESRLSILFDVKSARGIPNFLTPRKAQKTSSCWCVMSVAKRSSNKKMLQGDRFGTHNRRGLHLLAVTSCGLSFALTLMRRNADSMSQQTRNLSISTAPGDKCEIRQVHYQTIDLNEDKWAAHGETPRHVEISWNDLINIGSFKCLIIWIVHHKAPQIIARGNFDWNIELAQMKIGFVIWRGIQ